jgi:mannose-6-phosphate isomerase-like protein (cupin superfamily)
MTDRHLFPGAVGLTHLRVYDEATADGLAGGSPHVHLLSAEVYVPTRGMGSVQTYSAEGEREFELAPGGVVWFEPGIIHRLVNASSDLEILVVMQNAGLPEAGDAIFTFPTDVMANADAYAMAASLPDGTPGDRRRAAIRRRDLALAGFAELKTAGADGLAAFYRSALDLRRPVADHWEALLAGGGDTAAREARQRLADLRAGTIDSLLTARRSSTPGGDAHEGVGMCGTLRQYDLFAV